MLAAVIFDFDGIIVDTEPLHYKAFQEILVPLGYGYSWDEYLLSYIGYDDRDAFRAAFRVAGREIAEQELHLLIEEKARAFQRAIAAGVEPYPGVVELIRSLAGNIPLALCSGALPGDWRGLRPRSQIRGSSPKTVSPSRTPLPGSPPPRGRDSRPWR